MVFVARDNVELPDERSVQSSLAAERVGGAQAQEHEAAARAIRSEFAKARGESGGQGLDQATLDGYVAILRRDDGTVALAREVKTTAGGYRGFEAQVRQGANQVNQSGEIFVQVPREFDADMGRDWVGRFQASRTDEGLRKYDDVAVRFVNQGGDELGTYVLGERLRS